MKKLSTILFILISLSGSGQISVKDINGVTQILYTKAQTDAAIKVAIQAQAKIQLGVDAAQNTNITSITGRVTILEKNDTIFFDKNFAVVNGVVTFVGTGVNQKWVDSVNVTLLQHFKDITQLYLNGTLQAKATNDSIKAVRVSLKSTDSLNLITNGAARTNTRNITTANLRIDTTVQQITATNQNIDISISRIDKLENSLGLTNQQIQVLNTWADKVRALTFIVPSSTFTFPQ